MRSSVVAGPYEPGGITLKRFNTRRADATTDEATHRDASRGQSHTQHAITTAEKQSVARYAVQKNETLLDIVQREFGTTNVRSTLRDERNRGVFATGRTEHILKSGDELWLPDDVAPRAPCITVSTGRAHSLIARRHTRPFRVRAVAPSGEALANEDYEVRPDQGAVVRGTSDADGWIEAELLLQARSITIAIATREYRVALGSLDPAHTTAGIQGRLKNLGFRLGPVCEIHSLEVQHALRVFQARYGLPATGIGDAATVARLIQEHGD